MAQNLTVSLARITEDVIIQQNFAISSVQNANVSIVTNVESRRKKNLALIIALYRCFGTELENTIAKPTMNVRQT